MSQPKVIDPAKWVELGERLQQQDPEAFALYVEALEVIADSKDQCHAIERRMAAALTAGHSRPVH